VLREENGERKLLATLKAGDYFGEMALLADQSRNATIQARTTMNVLIIPKPDFDMLRHSVPAFGEIFRELAKRRTAHSAEPRASASGIPVNPSDSSET
jgi:CRP-like cAMP-binding protein